jgi:hypothetical protein
MSQNEFGALLESKAKLESVADGFEVWLHWGAVIVLAGVLIEAVYGIRAHVNNKKIHTVQESIDEYRRKEIVQLNERASEAKRKADEAALALEKFKAPRFRGFDKAKQDVVSEKIKPFAGLKFDAALSPNDAECEFLLDALEKVLKNGGLVQIPWKDKNQYTQIMQRDGKPDAGSASVVNIGIEGNFSVHPELLPAARAIASALTDAGIIADAIQTDTSHSLNADVMHLMIGKKM